MTSLRNKYRLGIDAGGTFTDFVLSAPPDKIHLIKTASTPHDGTIAIMNGLEKLSELVGQSAEYIVQNCDLCINGTTVALNALIEKTGAKIGLLCTAGHEDSLEIRLGHKEEGHRYDSGYLPAHMLARRHLRRPVRGRVLADGSIHTPLNEEDIFSAVKYFKEQNLDAVAISFLWSVVNGKHEARAKQLMQQEMPGVFVCTGSEVYPQIREYTRTSTTVVNAYLTPVLARYISKIDQLFNELGAKFPVRYYQSNGGLALGNSLRERAVNAINSGPASAPQAALHIAKPFNINNVITVDMGGTSFDITLTKNGKTNLNKNIDFLRYRIGVPMIQVETLGAGGGSIAHVNPLGMLEVGPQSAGSKPGPACYGLGGNLPTVTDANCAMGFLNPETSLAGTINLDRNAAIESIKKHIADPLKISVERAAYGISAIVNINMINGIRRVSIERGYDPRDFSLVCAGGASSMHINALAEEMGIDDILIPKVASGLCAFGQIISDVKYDHLATFPTRLEENIDYDGVNKVFKDIEEIGIKNLLSDGFSKKDILISRSVEMRYVGQIHECTVNISNRPFSEQELPEIMSSFHKRHEELYSYNELNSPVEMVNMESRLTAKVEPPNFQLIKVGDGNSIRAKIGHRDMIVSSACKWKSIPCYDGNLLMAGDVIYGPAVIEEPTTTIVVLPDWKCELHPSGSYRIGKKETVT